MSAAIDGLVLLDKPAGLSSHAAVSRVRRLCRAQRAGHVGSLDPLATGMLPVCLGEATKVAGLITAHDKCYEFTILLGERTDTGDAEGQVVERRPVPQLAGDRIATVLASYRGEQDQVPPMYSAIKQHGVPLYRLARRGETVTREPRAIRIDALDFLSLEGNRLTLSVICSKGTYVRVLGEAIAEGIGTVGHLSALRRKWVVPFEHLPMWDLGALEQAVANADQSWLLAASRALPHMPRLSLDAQQSQRLVHGQSLEVPRCDLGTIWLCSESGAGIGLGEANPVANGAGIEIRPKRMFTHPIA